MIFRNRSQVKQLIIYVKIYNMHYINKIKFICNTNKVTLKQLAKEINVSETGLHQMITNNTMKVETLQRIADYLEVPIVTFFEDEPNRNNVNIDKFLAGLKEIVLERINNK
jgi:transcriptional regulator with XRE-family HTH domain